MTTRPISPDLLPQWAGLLAACEAADHTGQHFSAADLAEILADPDIDPARGSLSVWHGPDMIADCLLQCRPTTAAAHQMRCYGGVHPAYRGRGIGSQLLPWAESAARSLHKERFGEQPLALEVQCEAASAGAMALFADHGYQEARRFHGMVCDLSGSRPDRPVPHGVRIAGFTGELAADALLVRNEAFRDHWGSIETAPERWQHHIGSVAFRAQYSLVGYDADGAPMSIVMCYEYDSATAATGRRDLYVALVATRRAGRGRGMASALLARALAAARKDGFESASLGVDADSPTGAVGLYERLGFRVASTRVTLSRDLR